MIELLTSYSTGNVFFDRLTDICVGVIVTSIAAYATWWLLGERDESPFENQMVKSSTRDRSRDTI